MQSGNLLSVGLMFTVVAWVSVLGRGVAVIIGPDRLDSALWTLGAAVVAVFGTGYFVWFFRRPVYRKWDDYVAALRSWEQGN